MKPGRLQVTFDCADPARVGVFWAFALGYPEPDVAGWHAFLREHGTAEEDLNQTFAIEDPDGQRPRLFFQRVPESKTVKNRLHLDVAAPDSGGGDHDADVDAQADRLVTAGATILRRVRDESSYYVVMADPEGNEFCVD